MKITKGLYSGQDLRLGPLGAGIEAVNTEEHKKELSDFFLNKNWTDVYFITALPIHRKIILKQYRNSVATYKLSCVSQEWQRRARYHLSLALLLAHHSLVAFCSGIPLSPNFHGSPHKSV